MPETTCGAPVRRVPSEDMRQSVRRPAVATSGTDRAVPATPASGPLPVDPAVGPPAHDPDLAETLRSFSDLRYRDVFWPQRRYEDRADRVALRALLPQRGGRLLEIGAGYGRLADEYGRYDEVVLLDASEALMQAARENLQSDARFHFVTGDAFHLPFEDAHFDAVVCIRVVHHFHDPRPAIGEMGRVLRPGGTLVLESANKRNVKSVIAFALGRTPDSPFARGSRPNSLVQLSPSVLRHTRPWRVGTTGPGDAWAAATSYLHAPRDLRGWLREAGLDVRATRSVGLFRLPVLTGHVPLRFLAAAEHVQQVALAGILPAPSVFVAAVRRAAPARDRAPASRPPG